MNSYLVVYANSHDKVQGLKRAVAAVRDQYPGLRVMVVRFEDQGLSAAEIRARVFDKAGILARHGLEPDNQFLLVPSAQQHRFVDDQVLIYQSHWHMAFTLMAYLLYEAPKTVLALLLKPIQKAGFTLQDTLLPLLHTLIMA